MSTVKRSLIRLKYIYIYVNTHRRSGALVHRLSRGAISKLGHVKLDIQLLLNPPDLQFKKNLQEESTREFGGSLSGSLG